MEQLKKDYKTALDAVHFKFYIGCPCAIFELEPNRNSVEPVPSTIEGIDVETNTIISERTTYQPIQIKPILRRIDTLSREELHILHEIWNIEHETFEASVFEQAELISYLTSIHIDVFNWIDKGFALDAGNLGLYKYHKQ